MTLEANTGERVTISLSEPSGLASLDQDLVGAAIVDSLGYVRISWGLASRVRILRPNVSVLLSELGGLLHEIYETGAGSIYVDGLQFIGSQMNDDYVQLLVLSASEEKEFRRKAELWSRESTLLKKFGRALGMNQSLIPLASAAVHELASAGDLAAALLWAMNRETGLLELVASTGANREATLSMATLDPIHGNGSAAELVAASRQPFYMPNVQDHMLTCEREGKFCYLKPGSVVVWPLVTGGNLIGVLELVSRDNDEMFASQLELMEIISEHLALAMNNAMLFESVEKMASHDSLTGIANHRTLYEFLSQRVNEAGRKGGSIGVIMMDVDHFRRFNEEEGHEAGDRALKSVAEAIRSAIRPYDLAARYGGEEFAVVLPGLELAETMATAERIRKRVMECEFRTASGEAKTISVSLGCACYPESGSDADHLLRMADKALYSAKRGGRNRVAA